MKDGTLLADGALRSLPDVLRRIDGTYHVIITGRQSYDQSGARRIIENLLGKETSVFYVEAKQPDLADFVRFRLRFGNDAIGLVAIGGGHIIDAAKLVSTDVESPQDVINRLAHRKPLRRSKPLIAVPTTAGSGSEATPFATVFINGVKHSIDDPTLRPDAVLIDPTLMVSLGKRDIAASGLDVVAQSIEALLSRRANSESDAYARAALSLAWPILPELHSTSGLTRFRSMAVAANLAGEAIAITRTTLPHALSYYFTQRFGVPHGHAIALSMGRYLALFGERLISESDQLDRWREPYFYILQTMGVHSGREVATRWTTYIEALGLESSPKQLGIGSRELRAIHPEINTDRLANAPITVSPAEIDQLWNS